jgi:hypothetical protein
MSVEGAGTPVQGRCQVCGEDGEAHVIAVPFAPMSLARKCEACGGTATLLEIDLLLGMAARRFERRLPTLLPTLALPVRIGDTTRECYRILLTDPLPRVLEHARWARPAAQRLADHLATGAPIDLGELAAACRAELTTDGADGPSCMT